MVNSDLSNDEVYTITKVIMENIEQYKQIHNNLKSMSVEQMADVTPASLHPGAEAYYKEAEILK